MIVVCLFLRKAFLIFATVLPTIALADFDVVARDFIEIAARTDACAAKATSSADLVGCAGDATNSCRAESGDWPFAAPRNCAGEVAVWKNLYQTEVMRMLDLARAFDEDALLMGSDAVADAVQSVMAAELAWHEYAGAQCALESLPDADKSYETRMASPNHCRERMYAERIFLLRNRAEASLGNAP